MKTILKSLAMAALFAGLGSTAYAQKTATAPASATILSDLNIALDVTQNEIAFGTLSATTTAGIVLDANGLANENTGTQTNVARFDLTGSDAAAVTVSYDATVTLEETVDGLESMVMTPEVVGAATAATQGTALAVGSGTTVTLASSAYFLWVGGTIPALVGQATGTYAGVFNISVEYN